MSARVTFTPNPDGGYPLLDSLSARIETGSLVPGRDIAPDWVDRLTDSELRHWFDRVARITDRSEAGRDARAEILGCVLAVAYLEQGGGSQVVDQRLAGDWTVILRTLFQFEHLRRRGLLTRYDRFAMTAPAEVLGFELSTAGREYFEALGRAATAPQN